MPYSNTATGTKEEICALRGKEIILNFPDAHKQKGGSDCGAFAIVMQHLSALVQLQLKLIMTN